MQKNIPSVLQTHLTQSSTASVFCMLESDIFEEGWSELSIFKSLSSFFLFLFVFFFFLEEKENNSSVNVRVLPASPSVLQKVTWFVLFQLLATRLQMID